MNNLQHQNSAGRLAHWCVFHISLQDQNHCSGAEVVQQSQPDRTELHVRSLIYVTEFDLVQLQKQITVHIDVVWNYNKVIFQQKKSPW